MEKQVTLTTREQTRLMVLNELERGALSAPEAAALVDLSVRQVRRLLAAYRKEGAAALAHGNRGRRPVNALDDDLRQAVIALARTHYSGVNQMHLSELLAEREGIMVSRSALRRILVGAGIPSPRHRRTPKHRSRRDRYPQRGMLLQLDGSRHDWLQGRGPWLTLHAGIDDATGEVHGAIFRDQEDAAGYMLLLRQVVAACGRPLAVYHDRHGIFGREPAADRIALQLAGRELDPTQVERLLQELEIASIPARTPQAKGRVERLFGTFQDRLVAELRLAGVSSCVQANAFLSSFLVRFNARFAVPPAQEGSAYRPLPVGMDPERLFCFKYIRIVAADNTIRFGTHRLQLLAGAVRASYARCQVEVHERPDGSLAVLYQGMVLATKPAPVEAAVLRARDGQRVPAISSRPRRERRLADIPTTAPPTPSQSSRTGRNPGAIHPWRAGYAARMAAKRARETGG